MKVPVFCAGALEVHWSYFTGVILAARAIRYFALAYLGVRYGTEAFLFLRKHMLEVAIIALLLSATSVLVLKLLRRSRSKRSKTEVVGG